MNLNSSQKAVTIGAIVVVFLMGLYPPWTATSPVSGDRSNKFSADVGYHSILVGPRIGRRDLEAFVMSFSVNSTLLLVQWIGVCIITGLLCAVLADKKKQ